MTRKRIIYSHLLLKRMLPYGVEEPLTFPPLSSQDFITLCIDQEGLDYKQMNLNWNKIGTTVFKGISEIEKTERIVAKVKNVLGSRKIFIRTDETIANFSGYPIEVSLCKKNQNTDFILTLEPREKRAPPMDFVGGFCDIFVRPNKKYNWVKWERNSPQLMSTPPSSRENKGLWACLAVMTEAIHGYIDFSIELHPMLIIENGFANELQYKTKCLSSGVEIVGSTIPSGVEEDVLYLSTLLLTDLAIFFKLPGFQWSEPLVLSDLIKQTNVTVSLLDKKNQKLTINVNLHTWIGESHHITVYAPYWLVNHSQQNLLYKGEKNLAAAQKTFHSKNGSPVPMYYANDKRGTNNILYYSESSFSLKLLDEHQMEWSKPFAIGIQNKSTVELVSFKNGPKYIFALSVRNAPDKFWRTRVVQIYPAYVLVNNSNTTISFTQTNYHISTVPPKSQIPFHWSNSTLPPTLNIILTDLGRSNDINPDRLGHFQMKLESPTRKKSPRVPRKESAVKVPRQESAKVVPHQDPGSDSSEWGMEKLLPKSVDSMESDREYCLNFEMRVLGVTKYVVVGESQKSPLYMIRNHTHFIAAVWEQS